MSYDVAIGLIVSTIEFATLLYLASLGETVAEKAGVLNLGVEGMMALGAMSGFYVGVTSGNLWLAFLVAGAVCGLAGFLHGIVAVVFGANQVVSGLALAILGIGVSGFLGTSIVGEPPNAAVEAATLGSLSDIPWLGPTIFSMSLISWFALLAGFLSWLVLRFTRFGLALRSVGESAATADAAGVGVVPMRLGAVTFGGVFAGFAGAYLSLGIVKAWSEGMVAGRGWIALALVIFGAWKVGRVLVGAILFGGMLALEPRLQRFDADEGSLLGFFVDNPIIVSALPFVLTVLVLVAVSARTRFSTVGAAEHRIGTRPPVAPAEIGRPFRREER